MRLSIFIRTIIITLLASSLSIAVPAGDSNKGKKAKQTSSSSWSDGIIQGGIIVAAMAVVKRLVWGPEVPAHGNQHNGYGDGEDHGEDDGSLGDDEMDPRDDELRDHNGQLIPRLPQDGFALPPSAASLMSNFGGDGGDCSQSLMPNGVRSRTQQRARQLPFGSGLGGMPRQQGLFVMECIIMRTPRGIIIMGDPLAVALMMQIGMAGMMAHTPRSRAVVPSSPAPRMSLPRALRPALLESAEPQQNWSESQLYDYARSPLYTVEQRRAAIAMLVRRDTTNANIYLATLEGDSSLEESLRQAARNQ